MTHNSIYTKFMIEYDKANVTSSYPSLTQYEVATVLDKAYNALIAQKITGNNFRKVGFEADLKAIEDIQPLITSADIALSNTRRPAPNVVTGNLKSDHLYFVNAFLKHKLNIMRSQWQSKNPVISATSNLKEIFGKDTLPTAAFKFDVKDELEKPSNVRYIFTGNTDRMNFIYTDNKGKIALRGSGTFDDLLNLIYVNNVATAAADTGSDFPEPEKAKDELDYSTNSTSPYGWKQVLVNHIDETGEEAKNTGDGADEKNTATETAEAAAEAATEAVLESITVDSSGYLKIGDTAATKVTTEVSTAAVTSEDGRAGTTVSIVDSSNTTKTFTVYDGARGATGATGAAGADGASAYEVYAEVAEAANQEVLSKEAWLESLKGAKGDKGDTGSTGATGAAGDSAYDIYVKSLSDPTTALNKQAWLESLKGADAMVDYAVAEYVDDAGKKIGAHITVGDVYIDIPYARGGFNATANSSGVIIHIDKDGNFISADGLPTEIYAVYDGATLAGSSYSVTVSYGDRVIGDGVVEPPNIPSYYVYPASISKTSSGVTVSWGNGITDVDLSETTPTNITISASYADYVIEAAATAKAAEEAEETDSLPTAEIDPNAELQQPTVHRVVSYINIPVTVVKDGATGSNGQNGSDGYTPYIQDGYWYINGRSTGVKAEGKDGTSVTILGSFNSIAEVQANGDNSAKGNGYLVNGNLVVWTGTEWQDVGTIQGPSGTDGTSATIATSVISGGHRLSITDASGVHSVDVLDGTDGQNAYITASESASGVTLSYTQDDGTIGTTFIKYGKDGKDGKDGTSISILGSYDTFAELEAAGDSSAKGNAYLVDGALAVWDGNEWQDAGSIQGPKGDDGVSPEVAFTKVSDGTELSITDATGVKTTKITDGIKYNFEIGTVSTLESSEAATASTRTVGDTVYIDLGIPASKNATGIAGNIVYNPSDIYAGAEAIKLIEYKNLYVWPEKASDSDSIIEQEQVVTRSEDISAPYDNELERATPVQLVNHNIATNFFSTAYNIPWIKIPVAYIEDNVLYVVYDPINPPMIDNAQVIYVKKPHPFVKNVDRIKEQYEITGDIDFFDIDDKEPYGARQLYEFECSDTFAEELISLAITFALENVESSRLNSKLNIRGLES